MKKYISPEIMVSTMNPVVVMDVSTNFPGEDLELTPKN